MGEIRHFVMAITLADACDDFAIPTHIHLMRTPESPEYTDNRFYEYLDYAGAVAVCDRNRCINTPYINDPAAHLL